MVMGVRNGFENVGVRELKLNGAGGDAVKAREVLERRGGDAPLAEKAVNGGGNGARACIIAGHWVNARRILKGAPESGLQSILDFTWRDTGFVGRVVAGLSAGLSVGVEGNHYSH